MTTRRSCSFAAAAAFGLCLAIPATAVEPFYSRLLEEGIRAYGDGDHASAAKSLRLACFGLLDEPSVLVRGLTYLALAQAEIGDQIEFAKTFERILELERRFDAYTELELDSDLRRTFDGYLQRWIALDVLAREPVFRRAARGNLEARIREMAPDEQRQELERLVALEPEDPTWRLLLAELRLDSSDFDSILATVEVLLARDPQLERARCLRARANAAKGFCEQALAELDACDEHVERLERIEAELRCNVQLGQWRSASELLSEVPPETRKRAPFRQLGREIRKGLRDVPPGQAAAATEAPTPADASLDPPAAAPAGPGPNTGAEAGPPAATPDLPPELQTELDRIRAMIKRGSRQELGETLDVARQLADLHPQVPEAQHLVAEIAYRLSRWQEAITYFRRGGEPRASQPDRLFYYSVALHETGDHAGAKSALERCLPFLERTGFVKAYAEELLGDGLD